MQKSREFVSAPRVVSLLGPSLSGKIGPVLKMLRRQALPIALCALVGLGYGVYSTLLLMPQYTAYTALLIDTRKVRAVQDAYAYSNSGETFDAGLATQFEVLRSDKVARSVLSRLTATSPATASSTGSGVPADQQTFTSAMKRLVREMLGRPPAPPISHEQVMAARQQAEINQLRQGLGIRRVGRSYIVEIAYTSTDPVKSARIANAYGEAYLSEQLQTHAEATTQATAWLRTQLGDLRQAVQASEVAVQKYKVEKNIVAPGGQRIDERMVIDLNAQLSAVSSEITKLEARYAKIKSVVNANQIDATFLEATSSGPIEQARTKFEIAKKNERDISKRLGPNHAAAVRLRTEAREFEKLTLTEMKRVEDATRSEIEILRTRETALKKQYEELLGSSSVANEAGIQLRELERNNETLKSLYSTATQRLQEANQQQSFPFADIRLMSAATLPASPIVPSSLRTIGAWLLAGLFAGTAIGATREMLDETIRTKQQAERFFGVNEVQYLPLLTGPQSDSPMTHVIDYPRSELVELLQSLKVTVDTALPDKRRRVIGFVSAAPGEGCSTLAKNMGDLLAQSGIATMLIDGDLRQPELSRLLAPKADKGLVDAATLGSAAKGFTVTLPPSGLEFLPVGEQGKAPHPTCFMSSPGLHSVLGDSSSSHAYVLVDLPCLSCCADAEAIAPFVDGFVFVIEWGKTQQRMIGAAIANNRTVHDKCLSVVINKAYGPALEQYDTNQTRRDYMKKYAGYVRP